MFTKLILLQLSLLICNNMMSMEMAEKGNSTKNMVFRTRNLFLGSECYA